MYCPNCQNRFDEFQNCYKSTEEVVDDNYYYSCFIKCPHCKTYLVQEKIYCLEFLDEEIFIDEKGKQGQVRLSLQKSLDVIRLKSFENAI